MKAWEMSSCLLISFEKVDKHDSSNFFRRQWWFIRVGKNRWKKVIVGKFVLILTTYKSDSQCMFLYFTSRSIRYHVQWKDAGECFNNYQKFLKYQSILLTKVINCWKFNLKLDIMTEKSKVYFISICHNFSMMHRSI